MNSSTNQLVTLVKKASANTATLTALLEHLLTPAESKEIVTRIQILERLLAGEQQRLIAEKLEIGIGTVTRGSREVARMSPALKKILGKK
jgi:TrpR family trp operon transcriptional repressor